MKKCINILLLLIFLNINQLYSMNNNDANLYIYNLKYLNARRTAFILNTIQEARNRRTSNEIIPVIEGNSNTKLYIKANKEDKNRIEKLIDELDKPQPQIYIIDLIDFKECLKGQK